MADMQIGINKIATLVFTRDDGSVGQVASINPWVIDNPAIASVALDAGNASGVVTPLSAGSTTMTAVGVREDGVEITVTETLNVAAAPPGPVTAGHFEFTDAPISALRATPPARRR